MADIKWSAFPSAGSLITSDTLVGLRSGANSKFTLTSTPTANAVAGWDANSRLKAKNFIPSFTTTVATAATVQLTVASTYLQEVTGAGDDAFQINLPNPSTLETGCSYKIINYSNDTMSVADYTGGNTTVIYPYDTFEAILTDVAVPGFGGWTTYSSQGTLGSDGYPIFSSVLVSNAGALELLGGNYFSCVDNAGTFYNTLNNISTTAARTWSLPDASGTIALTSGASGIVNSGTAGQLTYYAGTGTTVSGANAGTGVITALGQNVTGSGAIALATSPTFVTPVLGAASATSVAFSSTSGIIGTTTNDNAAAGSVGEIISSTGSGVSLTTGTPSNACYIDITAGDWDVWGTVNFTGDVSTTVVQLYGWTSATASTFPAIELRSQVFIGSPGAAAFASSFPSFTVPVARYSVSGTTSIYLSGAATFAVSTATLGGAIYARRRR